jgi:hypothetical protein
MQWLVRCTTGPCYRRVLEPILLPSPTRSQSIRAGQPPSWSWHRLSLSASMQKISLLQPSSNPIQRRGRRVVETRKQSPSPLLLREKLFQHAVISPTDALRLISPAARAGVSDSIEVAVESWVDVVGGALHIGIPAEALEGRLAAAFADVSVENGVQRVGGDPVE